MKKNISILIGIAVLFAVLYAGKVMLSKNPQADASDVKTEVGMKSFVGQVVRVFEGEHVLEYSIDLPETATTTIDMEGALIRVVDQSKPLTQVYMSYEGGRGYSPLEYIDNVIAPKVAAIDLTSTSTIGAYEWQGAESVGSEWHVAKVSGGEWLIVVENKKADHDTVEKILNSISVK